MTFIAAIPPVPKRRYGLVALLLGALLAMPSQAQTTQRIAVTEIKTLLTRAAERGAAHGVLTGPGADYIRRSFDTTAPIEIDVRRLHPLPPAGCARLQVTTHQRDVLENGSNATTSSSSTRSASAATAAFRRSANAQRTHTGRVRTASDRDGHSDLIGGPLTKTSAPRHARSNPHPRPRARSPTGGNSAKAGSGTATRYS